MLKSFFLNEKNMLLAIVLNAIVIFLMYFPQIENGHPSVFHWLDFIDHLFVVIFLVEAIIKLIHFKPKGYFGDNWNVFDFVIVVFSLPSLFHYLGFALIPNTSFLKILRLFRLIRLVKFMRFIPRMEIILMGLTRAIKASVFVMIALVFMNFLLALFTCHFYGDLVPEYFGDPLISSYYIFQMFTVEGWNEIPNVVAEAAEKSGMENAALIIGMARVYFIFVVLAGGIFGMSLANAVFVDEMTSDNNMELEEKIDELHKDIKALKTFIKNNKD